MIENEKKKEDARKNSRRESDDGLIFKKNMKLLEWSRSDSPVRMYLREMGKIPLLTKEEEIEISKRIEKGENIIIDAICSVPYLIGHIINDKEPLINRERRVKELFKSLRRRKRGNGMEDDDDGDKRRK